MADGEDTPIFDEESAGVIHTQNGKKGGPIFKRNYNRLVDSGKLQHFMRNIWREYMGTVIGVFVLFVFIILVLSQFAWYEHGSAGINREANKKSPIAWHVAIVGDSIELVVLIAILIPVVMWHRKHVPERTLPLTHALSNTLKACKLVGVDPNGKVEPYWTELANLAKTLELIEPWLNEVSTKTTNTPLPLEQTTLDEDSEEEDSKGLKHLQDELQTGGHIIDSRRSWPVMNQLHKAQALILREWLRLNNLLEKLYYGTIDVASDFQIVRICGKNDTKAIRFLEKTRQLLVEQQDAIQTVIKQLQMMESDRLKGESRPGMESVEVRRARLLHKLKKKKVSHHDEEERSAGGEFLFLILAGMSALYMLMVVVRWWYADGNDLWSNDWEATARLFSTIFPLHVLLLYSVVEYFANVTPYSKAMPRQLKWAYKVLLQYLVWWNLTWAFVSVVLDYHSGFSSLLDSLGLAATIDFRLHVVAHIGELAAMRWFSAGKKGPRSLLKRVLRYGRLREWIVRQKLGWETNVVESGEHRRHGFAAAGRSWALILVGSLSFGFVLHYYNTTGSDESDSSAGGIDAYISLGAVIGMAIGIEVIVVVQLLGTFVITGWRKEPDWIDVKPKKLLQITAAGALFILYQFVQSIAMFVKGEHKVAPYATMFLSISSVVVCYHLIVYYPRKQYIRSHYPGLWVAILTFMEIHNYLWLLIDVVTERAWTEAEVGTVFDAFGLAAAVNFRLLSASMYGEMAYEKVTGIKHSSGLCWFLRNEEAPESDHYYDIGNYQGSLRKEDERMNRMRKEQQRREMSTYGL